jgi:RNA 3'-terminal phosphate cyclase
MKIAYCSLLLLFSFATVAFAQGRTADQIREEVKSAGFGQSITVEYDTDSNTTRIRGVSENFPQSEARRAGVRAINFAAGVIAAGNGLKKSANEFLFSFWILAEKPQFAEEKSVEFVLGSESFLASDFRYAARPRDKMEYINISLSRIQLEKIATASAVGARIGSEMFTFTPQQRRLLLELLKITDIE